MHPSPPPPPAPGAPTPPWPPIPVAVVAPAGPPPRCAWEDAPGVTTWFETARAVLGSPRQTFRGVAPRNGLGLPMLFWLCGTVAGMIGAGSWRLLRMYQVGRLDDMSAAQTFGIVAIAFALALAFVSILLFVAAGIVHGLLLLLGAGRRGFEATFRTLAYAHGSGAMFGVIPFIGSTVGLVWTLAVAVPGLAEMQETNTGTAAIAVLAPAVLCCGATIFLFVIAVSVVAAR